ncbi:MAG: hypothetical protein IJT78_02870 [Oscillospiraceae bacterium]|nr:hypothetical protein [Oscillospiraceae bacterium]
MNVMKRTCTAVFAALFVLLAAIPAVFADAVYEDGAYTASLTFEGGTGRIVWNSPVAVTVEGGVLYADLVMSKPNGETPSVEWMEYNGVRYTAQVDASAKTCSFYHVPVTNPAVMKVSTNTTAMSAEHVVEYTLCLNVSAIPTVSGGSFSSQPDQDADTPEAAAPQEDEKPADLETTDDEMLMPETDDVALDGGVLTTGGVPESETSSGTLPVPVIVAMAAGGVIVLGGGAYLLLRGKKNKSDEA